MVEMIPPDEQAERSREHLDSYRPKLEEMFDISLDDLLLEDRETYIETRFFNSIQDPKEKLKEREKVEKRLKNVAAMHDHFYRTIYAVCTYPLSDETLANNTVHEAAHGIHSRLVDVGQAKKVISWPVWRFVQEGFAEYMSLEAFKESYDLPDIESNLENRRKWHKSASETYVKKKLHRFHDSFQKKEIVVPWNLRESSYLKKFLHKMRMRLVRFSSGSPEEYYHNMGYTFFKIVCDAGVSPEDIVRDPPEDLEMILNPADYIKEMTS